MIYSFNKLIDTIFVYYVTNRLYAFTTLVTVYDIQSFHGKKKRFLSMITIRNYIYSIHFINIGITRIDEHLSLFVTNSNNITNPK